MEAKIRQLMVNVEPTLYDMILQVIGQEDISASAYLRSLVVKDLMERQLLTQEKLCSLLGVIK